MSDTEAVNCEKEVPDVLLARDCRVNRVMTFNADTWQAPTHTQFSLDSFDSRE